MCVCVCGRGGDIRHGHFISVFYIHNALQDRYIHLRSHSNIEVWNHIAIMQFNFLHYKFNSI